MKNSNIFAVYWYLPDRDIIFLWNVLTQKCGTQQSVLPLRHFISFCRKKNKIQNGSKVFCLFIDILYRHLVIIQVLSFLRRSLPLLLVLRQFQHRLLRNLFQVQQDLHGLQKIHLLPYLHRHTSGRMHA